MNRLQGLRVVLGALALLALVVLAGVVAARADHPFELEWQEGGVLAHVERVLAGEPLYTAPGLEFIAFPYPPLYYVVGAAVAHVGGAGFLALRLVSILSTIAALIVIHRWTARRSQSALAGLVAAGLFAAAYRLSGAWLDVARVDALSLALTLAGLAWLDARRGVGHAVGAGCVLFLAFFAKQSALLPAAGCIAGLALGSRRDALACAGTLLALVAATTLVLDARTDGWYRAYVFDQLAGQGLDAGLALGFAKEISVAYAPLIALAGLVAWRGTRDAHRDLAQDAGEPKRGVAPFAGALVGFLLVAGVGRAHPGGYDNTLLPACAAAAVGFGCALARLHAAGGWVATAAGVLGVLQFALLAYDPRAQLPTEADRTRGAALVERLRATPGEVWMPDHGYLAERAGKRPSAHGMAVIDLLRSNDRATAQRFVDELVRAIEERRYAAIVLDRPWDDDLPPLARRYRRDAVAWPDERALVPVTGDPRRPAWWYSPRRDE
ncbi:MAG: hypothetical protein IPJ77_21815 [Planctomycetes bacterium]|nr:hypothetical protein [Planctomycetota bacterium]